jgi:PIN domain nuclease of toxin-antitoxin system
MMYLLDSSAFIWLSDGSGKLSPKAYQACYDRNNKLYLSLASVWEIQLKVNLGKLHLNAPLPDLLKQQQQVNDIDLLAIQISHIMELSHLPDLHRDPFDRLLIAQARVEGLTLITPDFTIPQYPVPVLWS